MEAKSLELFFVNGKPDGMLTAEVFNWTGHILVAPRIQLSEALSRKQTGYTGVYVLLGEKDGKQCAYIGEGEKISDRVKSHAASKDWWDKVIFITTSANNLHKAHVQYLEARLIGEARTTNIVELDNSQKPDLPSLQEAAKANMESFLDYLLMALPALRVDMFLKKTRSQDTETTTDSSVLFELLLKKANIRATAKLVDGEFVVQKGSKARKDWVGASAYNQSYSRLHQKLVSQGILVEDGSMREFSESYAFSSTSAAGAVINGRSTAGPIKWKVAGSEKTYRDWELENLEGEVGI